MRTTHVYHLIFILSLLLHMISMIGFFLVTSSIFVLLQLFCHVMICCVSVVLSRHDWLCCSCFIALLLIAGCVWKIKRCCDRHRAIQVRLRHTGALRHAGALRMQVPVLVVASWTHLDVTLIFVTLSVIITSRSC